MASQNTLECVSNNSLELGMLPAVINYVLQMQTGICTSYLAGVAWS